MILILEKARFILQKHHDWHLSQNDEIKLDDDVSIVLADEYFDSSIYDETIDVLNLLETEIKRLTTGN